MYLYILIYTIMPLQKGDLPAFFSKYQHWTLVNYGFRSI